MYWFLNQTCNWREVSKYTPQKGSFQEKHPWLHPDQIQSIDPFHELITIKIATRWFNQPISENIPQIGSVPQGKDQKNIFGKNHSGWDRHAFFGHPIQSCLEASHALVDFFGSLLNTPVLNWGQFHRKKEHLGESCQNDKPNQGHLGGLNPFLPYRSLHNQKPASFGIFKMFLKIHPPKKYKNWPDKSPLIFFGTRPPGGLCLTPPNPI